MPQSPDGMAELCQGSRDTWTPSSEEGLRCFMSQTMTWLWMGMGGWSLALALMFILGMTSGKSLSLLGLLSSSEL